MRASLHWWVGLLSVCAAPATQAGCSAEYATCRVKAHGISSEIQSCQSTEESRQEVNLESAYRGALKKLSPERRKELQKVQSAWSQYRIANARFYVDTGLSGHKIRASDDWLRLTCERVVELKQIDE
jgi:uncharacterized protein YecT (DUF1311 family)